MSLVSKFMPDVLVEVDQNAETISDMKREHPLVSRTLFKERVNKLVAEGKLERVCKLVEGRKVPAYREPKPSKAARSR